VLAPWINRMRRSEECYAFLHATVTSSRIDFRELIMIGRSRPLPLFPKKLNPESIACAWNQQICLHNKFARRSSLRETWSPISLHAKLGLSLASFLSLVAVGCSLSQLNLDSTQRIVCSPHAGQLSGATATRMRRS
jgi:hypothetical protein